MYALIVPVLCIIISLILGYIGFKQLRLYNTMNNLATSPINAITAGQVEVVGMSECETPLTSPLSATPCAGYRYSVYKRVQTKDKTEWKLVSDQKKATHFVLRDSTGTVTVHPSKAKLIVMNKTVVRSNTLKRAKVNRYGRYKFIEHILPLDTQLYVIGNAQVKGDNYVIMQGDDYVITDKSEQNMVQQYFLSSLSSFIVSILLLLFGIIQTLNILDWHTFLGGL